MILLTMIQCSGGSAAWAGAEACWSYDIVENFRVRDRWTGREVHNYKRSSRGFATREECERAASANRSGWEDKSNTIYEYYRREYTPCSCDGPRVATPSDDLERSFERQLVDDEVARWFLQIVAQVGPDQLLTLTSLYPESQLFASALANAGTMLSAVQMAQAYVDLSDRVVGTSLDRAFAVLNVPSDRRAQFIAAAGAFADAHLHPGGTHFENYFRHDSVAERAADALLDDPVWARTAVGAALVLVGESQSDVDDYFLAVALGLAGYLAVRDGHPEAGRELLSASLGVLGAAPGVDAGRVSALKALLEQASTPPSTAVAATVPDAPRWAGVYRCSEIIDYGPQGAYPAIRASMAASCSGPSMRGVVSVADSMIEYRTTDEQQLGTLRVRTECKSAGWIEGSIATLRGTCTPSAGPPFRFDLVLELTSDGALLQRSQGATARFVPVAPAP